MRGVSVLGCRGRSGELWEEVWRVWGRCREVCLEVRKDVWGVEKYGWGCGRVYGVSGEVCWRLGRGMGEV